MNLVIFYIFLTNMSKALHQQVRIMYDEIPVVSYDHGSISNGCHTADVLSTGHFTDSVDQTIQHCCPMTHELQRNMNAGQKTNYSHRFFPPRSQCPTAAVMMSAPTRPSSVT